MPKLGWMFSSQTQTKFPWLREHVESRESKSSKKFLASRGKGASQCGTEGATSACQGSELEVDVLMCFVCVCL